MPKSRLVYSTDAGRVARPDDRSSPPSSLPADGIVRIFRDRAGRRGKVVTIVRGLPDRGQALEARTAVLKRLCGAGGTVKDGVVEIQGDHREQIAEHLRAAGLAVKLAGG
jgi:translation initiation factor 1